MFLYVLESQAGCSVAAILHRVAYAQTSFRGVGNMKSPITIAWVFGNIAQQTDEFVLEVPPANRWVCTGGTRDIWFQSELTRGTRNHSRGIDFGLFRTDQFDRMMIDLIWLKGTQPFYPRTLSMKKVPVAHPAEPAWLIPRCPRAGWQQACPIDGPLPLIAQMESKSADIITYRTRGFAP